MPDNEQPKPMPESERLRQATPEGHLAKILGNFAEEIQTTEDQPKPEDPKK